MNQASSTPPSGGLDANSNAFKALVLGAAQRVIDHAIQTKDSADPLMDRFPCLLDYAQACEAMEAAHHEPLAALAQAAQWSATATELWLVCGLVDEDARFGDVFEALDPQARQRRPSMALMQDWWGTLPREGVRPALRPLLECGVLQACNPGAASSDQLYEVEENCWAAARGEPPAHPAHDITLTPCEQAPLLEHLLLPQPTAQRIDDIAPRLIQNGGTLLLRGPAHNGRASLLAALARSEGRPALHIDWPMAGQDPAQSKAPKWLGAFATLTGARPIVHVQACPGEPIRLPTLQGYQGWMGVVCGDDDAFDEPASPVWSVHLPLPDAPLRRALVERHGNPVLQPYIHALADSLHLSAGHLVQALQQDPGTSASLSALTARLRETALACGSAPLDSLARRIDASGPWQDLVLDHELRRDLDSLEARCRQRERLRDALPASFAHRLNAGVRALFAGPSGTGKTLAAQVLAARLGLPLYRLDLSCVVSKYIGETERNLDRLLGAAEALDVMLLLDEGDALLAKRTDVGNAHDRYANLETNFLLQRLETHRGLVLVTTNALDRVDTAFLRRFDHLLNFRAPDVHERAALWQAHLPAHHAVTARYLAHVAEACALSGGQIRNVALSAASTALAGPVELDDTLLLEALRREYRRSGSLCPMGRG